MVTFRANVRCPSMQCRDAHKHVGVRRILYPSRISTDWKAVVHFASKVTSLPEPTPLQQKLVTGSLHGILIQDPAEVCDGGVVVDGAVIGGTGTRCRYFLRRAPTCRCCRSIVGWATTIREGSGSAPDRQVSWLPFGERSERRARPYPT